MAERVAIIVVGMHRSGSSAMARVLSLAGAALPKLLMAAGDGNETGHWEPQRVADYNDTVLAAFDASWDSPFGLGMNATRRAALEPFVDGARDIIREEYGEAPLIVLKEPRISLVVDLWIKALEAEGFRCKFVITVRAPTEVAASLRKRNGFALDKGLLLWGVYQASSEVLTRSYDRIFCRYDDVLARPASVLDEIEAQLRIELPRRTAQSHAEMDAFVRPVLKRNDASAIPPIPDHLKPIRELSEYIYASIVGETPNIDVSRDLQNWFADLDQTITPLMIGIEQRLQIEVASVQGQVDAYRTEIERINTLYGEQLADIARLNAQFAEIEDVRVETEHRFTAAEHARHVVQAQLEERETELANLLGTLGAANSALSEVSATLDGRTAELAQAGAEYAATMAQLQALSNTNAQLEADLAATRMALAAQSTETAALQAELVENAARQAEAEGELAELRAREAALVANADLLAATIVQTASEHAVASSATEARHEAERELLLLAVQEREATLQVALDASHAAQAALAERLGQTAAEADAERTAASARESALVAEAAAIRDAVVLADETSVALRVALTQAQDAAALREADLLTQIDALHANVRAGDERGVVTEQAIAAINSRNEDLIRSHAEDLVAASVSADHRLAVLRGALDQTAAERDHMRAELDQLRAAGAESARSAAALLEVVAERDATLAEYAGQITMLTQSMAELDYASTAQRAGFADEEQKAHDRELGLNAALRAEMKLREDDHVERQSLAYRIRVAFGVPKRRLGDTDAV
jgi:hypothetical protein